MQVISIYNNKGGVGKTTSAINIAYCLSKANYKTVIIDSDSQSNATNTFLNNKKNLKGNTFYEVMKSQINISDCLIEIDKNFYLIPNTIKSSILDIELIGEISRESILRQRIRENKAFVKKFDFVIIDCSPSMSITNVNNLVASDYYLIPCQLEHYCLEGIPNVYQFVDTVKRVNKDLKFLGCFGTFNDKRKISNKEILEMLKKFFEKKFFSTVISDSVKVSEAPSHGKTIFEYESKNKVSTEYVKLTNEITRRIK